MGGKESARHLRLPEKWRAICGAQEPLLSAVLRGVHRRQRSDNSPMTPCPPGEQRSANSGRYREAPLHRHLGCSGARPHLRQVMEREAERLVPNVCRRTSRHYPSEGPHNRSPRHTHQERESQRRDWLPRPLLRVGMLARLRECNLARYSNTPQGSSFLLYRLSDWRYTS
jgi:hypothetical protein